MNWFIIVTFHIDERNVLRPQVLLLGRYLHPFSENTTEAKASRSGIRRQI